MKLSQAIYRLSKMARVLDIDDCEDDVIALNMAVDVMSDALVEEQSDASMNHVVRPSYRGKREPSNIANKVNARL